MRLERGEPAPELAEIILEYNRNFVPVATDPDGITLEYVQGIQALLLPFGFATMETGDTHLFPS